MSCQAEKKNLRTMVPTGINTSCLEAHSSSIHSHRQLRATQVALRTPASGSLRPVSITGHTCSIIGVMYSLQPSTDTPRASIAPRRRFASGDWRYCWIRVRRGGKTWVGGSAVAKLSIIRSADLKMHQELRGALKISWLTRQGASSSESSGSGSVVTGISPCKIAVARPWFWILNFLLWGESGEPLSRKH